jgi:hypothetical protein
MLSPTQGLHSDEACAAVYAPGPQRWQNVPSELNFPAPQL